MESVPRNRLLEYHADTLDTVRKRHGFEERDDMKKAIDELDEWVKKQHHFMKKDFSRHYLEMTIISSKGSLERARERLEQTSSVRTKLPQFFGDFDVKKDFKEFDRAITHAIMPKLTKDHYRVFVVRNCGKKFQPNMVLQYARMFIMFLEYMKAYDYYDGITVIADQREVSLIEVVRRMNLTDFRHVANIVIGGYGTRLKAIHLVSNSKIISLVVWTLKQVLSAKLGNRIQVHRSLKTLYNFFPKSILPVDYDGDEICLDNLHDDWRDVFSSEEFREYQREMTKVGIDESLRRQSEDESGDDDSETS